MATDCTHCNGTGERRTFAIFARSIEDARGLLRKPAPGDRVVAMDDCVQSAADGRRPVSVHRCDPGGEKALRRELQALADVTLVTDELAKVFADQDAADAPRKKRAPAKKTTAKKATKTPAKKKAAKKKAPKKKGARK